MPKLSIITVNLNNLHGLEKTMQSVFAQTFTDYEYIIIDGGSTDGSKEYIEQHADKLTYWISEKDEGIYNALNKGSKIAKGEYLHHLNSSDTYYSKDVLKDLFSTSWTQDFIYGNQNLPGYFLKTYPNQLTLEFFSIDAIPHQATIIKRSFFSDSGFFSTKYSMGGDYKFFLEAVYIHQCKYAYSGITMVNYDMKGVSMINSEHLIQQFKDIREESIPNLLQELLEFSELKQQLYLLKKSRILKWRNKLKTILWGKI